MLVDIWELLCVCVCVGVLGFVEVAGCTVCCRLEASEFDLCRRIGRGN